MKLFPLLLACFALCGCAVMMSSQRSAAKGDVNIIQVGADRIMIEEAFGPPDEKKRMRGGRQKAIYRIDPKAYSEGARNAAVAGHATADFVTGGFWEIAGTPIELALQDEYTNYVIVYDKDGIAESVDIIPEYPEEEKCYYWCWDYWRRDN